MDKLFSVTIRDYIPGEPPLATLHISNGVAGQMQETGAHGRIEVEHGEKDRDANEPIAHIVRAVDEMITDDGEPFEDGMGILRATLVRMRDAHGGMSISEQDDTAKMLDTLTHINGGELF